MSELSNFTGKFRVHKNGSHESSAANVTKRPRHFLVCNQCRRSRLRCDRGQPCVACVKRDNAAACSYHRSTGIRVDTNRHTVAEDRLLHLESMVKHLMETHETSSSSNDAIFAETVAQSELPHDTGEDVPQRDQARSEQVINTRYVGSTYWSAILDDIHELRAVLDGSPEVHEAQELIESEASASGREPIFGSSNNYSCSRSSPNIFRQGLRLITSFRSTFGERPSFFLSFIQSTSNVNIEIFGPTLKKSTLFGFPFCFPSAIWRL